MSKPKPLPKFALLKDLIEKASKHQRASQRLHFHRFEVQITGFAMVEAKSETFSTHSTNPQKRKRRLLMEFA